MPQKLTLATAATLSILGGLTGVQLGRGAIADIDPFFFTPLPESRFFADLVPAGYDPGPVTLASDVDEVWTNNINVSGRAECFDCGNFVDGITLARVADAPPALADSEAAYVPPIESQDYMPREVERYAYFPVSQEEAARPRRNQLASETEQREPASEEEPELLNM